MNIFIFNIPWMIYNLLLAIVPVIAGLAFLKGKNIILKILTLIIFLIFLPNTLYLITDLLHLPGQLKMVDESGKILLIIQYFILEIMGLLSFILSINIFEKMLTQLKLDKKLIILFIIILNFSVGFGIVLGRILRINSWDIFVNTEKVINDSFYVLSSIELILMAIIFGIIGNLVYFLAKDHAVKLLTYICNPLKSVTIKKSR